MKANFRMSQLTRGLLSVAIVSTGVITTYHNDAVAAVSNSKHNLGSTQGVGNNKVSDTAEVCVFCHTPHGADVSTTGAPLWNKKFTSGTFSPYVATSTLDGASATDGLSNGFLSGASLACLSCHDGTQAIDNLLNAPGSGGMSANGGSTTGLAYTWTIGSNSSIDTYGQFVANAAANLGQDMSNDHPIGIRYCGGGPVVLSPATACVDADFVTPSTAAIGSSTVFWVDTGTGGRQKTDMQLYNRAFAAGGAGPSVECASCHDVHSESALFLRIQNASSAVCLACHIK